MSEQQQNGAGESEATRVEWDRSGDREPGPYEAAVSAYLDQADWLDSVLDGPVVVHARSLAVSLDRQLAGKGEVQSALAGSFDKCLLRLNERRPKPGPAPVDPYEDSPDGTVSLFQHLSG